jgi:RNA polymerase sigma factor for flagellar operon FliA
VDSSNEAEHLRDYAYVARWIASRYATGRSLAAEWDDVHADALIGVLAAIRNFDSTRKITQKAYVFIRARGAAIDGIRQRLYAPRSKIDNRREPTSLDRIRVAITDGDGTWEPSASDPGYGEVDAAETISLLLVHLSRRRRFVIEAYYLAGRSMADIGAELGVTESRVCQIHVQALRQMRAMLAEGDM